MRTSTGERERICQTPFRLIDSILRDFVFLSLFFFLSEIFLFALEKTKKQNKNKTKLD
jgi:hypothetical protein